MSKKKKQELTAEERLQEALVPQEECPYEVPENWVWVELGYVVQTSKAKTDTFNSDVKYVGLEHMEKDGGVIGYGDATDLKSTKNLFSVGDVLYGKLRPYLNKHDVATFEGVCSTDILVFKSSEQCNINLVNYFMDLDYFIDLSVSNSKGINLPRVSQDVLLRFPFPLPPLPEQQRIVTQIETLFHKLDKAKELIKPSIDVKGVTNISGEIDHMKKSILARAFRGQLGTNDPKDQSILG